MKVAGTIRWAAPSTEKAGVYTVVVYSEQTRTKYVLWSRDAWLAAFCERANITPRPVLLVTFDKASKRLEGVEPIPAHVEA